jgi:hypothetical protein
MATKGKIDELFTIPELEAQHLKVIAMIQDVVKAINDVKPVTISLQGAEKTKEIIDGLNQVSQASKNVQDATRATVNQFGVLTDMTKKAQQSQEAYAQSSASSSETIVRSAERISKLKLSLQELNERQKEYKKLLDEDKISIDEYSKRVAHVIEVQEQYKNQISDLSKVIKDNTAVQFAQTNSITEAKAQNKILTTVRDNVDVNDVDRIKDLNDQIDRNNKLIDENSDKLAKQKINIGNYPTAFKAAFGTLEGELTAVSNQLQTGGFKGKELDELKIKQQALQNATALVSKEFASTAAQQTAFKEAATQIGVVYGSNSEVFKKFNSQVSAGSAQIKNVVQAEAVAVESTNKFGGALGRAWSVLRNIAYIVPGLGIAGIIGLLLTPITAFASKVFEADEATKKLEESTKKEAEELKQLTESFKTFNNIKDAGLGASASDVIKVQSLSKVILDQANSYKDRNAALLELRDINKNYFGDLSLEKSSLQQLKTAVEDYTNAIIQQAVIKEVEGEIGKVGAAYFRQLRIVQDLEKAHLKESDALQKSTQAFRDNATARGQRAFLLTDAATALRAQHLTDESAKLKPLADQYNSLGRILSDLNIQQLKIKPLKGGEQSADAKALQKKFFDDELKQQAEDAKKLSEINDLELASRINERQIAASKEIEIVKGASAVELQNEEAKLNAVKVKRGVSKKEILNATAEFANAEQKILQKESEDLVKIELNRQRDIIGIRLTSAARQIEIDKKLNQDTLKFFYETYNKQLKALQDREEQTKLELDKGKDYEIEALNRNYQKQIASAKGNQEKIKRAEEAYNKERANIEFRYAAEVLRVEIETGEKILALHRAQGLDTTKEEDALAKLKMQLSDLVTDHVVKNNDRQHKSTVDGLERVGKAIQKVKEYSDQVFSIIGGALDNSITAQKNALQDQSDAIDKKKDKEIEAVNSSVASEQDKAAKIAIINARAQAQKDQLDIKQRQLDAQKARFDKAKTITDIILNGALAVIKQLVATPLPFGAPFVAAIGALTAAQLAVAIAAPIPHYEKGIKRSPEGPAIVGEKRSEIIRHPDGTMYVTPDKPTLVYLPKDSEVIPDASDRRELMRLGVIRSLRSPEERAIRSPMDARMLEYYARQTSRIVNAIHSAPVPVVKNSWSGWTVGWKRGQDWYQYVKDSV